MMPQVTFITPIGPRHIALYPRALASIEAQTVPVLALSMADREGLGPGRIRNMLLSQTTTEYVVFLDADDEVESDFVERTLRAIKPAHYVYTDWFQDSNHVQASERPWCEGKFHLVTSLIRTEDLRAVEGFDEQLEGLEDTDLFLRLMQKGICGIRVPVPLVHYSSSGGRADRIHADGSVDILRREINRRYGGFKMGCCGGESEMDKTPVGEQQPGDILVVALWGGNRAEFGRVTGRRYPRTSWPHQVWVDPRDAQARPDHWQRVLEQMPIPQPAGIDAIEGAMMQKGVFHVREPEEVLPAGPEFDKLKKLAGVVSETQDGPIFLKPEKDYPSYRDFWKLVELAGFRVMSEERARLDQNETWIVVSPEGIRDYSFPGNGPRIIFWQLEYTGDYTDQANKHTISEHWSSDPAHAARTGSKFVLLGSDARLADEGAVSMASAETYDFIMLAYMTERRSIIKHRLIKAGLKTPSEYPGHEGMDRAYQLLNSKLMVAVHQNEEKALAPLRLALAAAYSLPVISEAVDDQGPYWSVKFTKYQSLAKATKELLKDDVSRLWHREGLHQLLCIDHPFRNCVLEALQS